MQEDRYQVNLNGDGGSVHAFAGTGGDTSDGHKQILLFNRSAAHLYLYRNAMLLKLFFLRFQI